MREIFERRFARIRQPIFQRITRFCIEASDRVTISTAVTIARSSRDETAIDMTPISGLLTPVLSRTLLEVKKYDLDEVVKERRTAAEVGQGVGGVILQVARTELDWLARDDFAALPPGCAFAPRCRAFPASASRNRGRSVR